MTRDEKFLLTLGGSVSMKGFHYITKGLELARENPELMHPIVKRLYPAIAQQFPGVKPEQVERCIRSQITSIYKNAIELPSEFNNPASGKVMTNKEFMARLLKVTKNLSET